MKSIYLFHSVILVLCSGILIGCGGPHGAPKGTVTEDDHDHGPGPHDGTIIEFGRWHGEFTVNHKTQEATVYILGPDAKKPVALQVEKLLLSIKAPQFQVELKAAPQEGDPAGKASRFVAKHENFGKEQDFEGTLSGVVNGKPYAGDFKEQPHKDHQPEKK